MLTSGRSGKQSPFLFLMMLLLILGLIALFILLRGNGDHPGVKPGSHPSSGQTTP